MILSDPAPIPFLWIINTLARVIRNLSKKKRCWIVMGDAKSGKSELLCLLQDIERHKKEESELSHSKNTTPGYATKVFEVLNQTVTFCDGPGAIEQKKARMNYLLNNPVKNAIATNQELILIYMIDMMKFTHDNKERNSICSQLLPEVGMFLKGLAQFTKTGHYDYEEAKSCDVSDAIIANAGGKVLVIGTHMDQVRTILNSAQICEAQCFLQQTIEKMKMDFPLSPFVKNVLFDFIFADIYGYNGRCEFIKAFCKKIDN